MVNNSRVKEIKVERSLYLASQSSEHSFKMRMQI